jgi:peroxin-13
VPTRNTNLNLGYNSNNTYGTMFNSYGTGGYGGYSSYGGYGAGYNGYSSYNSPFGYNNFGNNPSSGFLRAAEDSSRNAFQSIESIVHAFSAVSAMFESTFHAVYNSFRAVVGVADQLYRLKSNLASIFSAFALLKTLKYLYFKLLRILRLRSSNDEDFWAKEINVNDAEKMVKDKRKATDWPLVLFFAVITVGPWLIWKMLRSVEAVNKDESWMTGKIDHFVASAEYDFDAENSDEISFKKGQKLIIAPKGISCLVFFLIYKAFFKQSFFR